MASSSKLMALSCIMATILLASGSPPGVPQYSPPYSPLPEQSYSSNTCSDAVQANQNFLVDVGSGLGSLNTSALDGVEGYVNFNLLGQFLANASAVADFNAASTVLNDMGNLISSDFQASGDTWGILFRAINFSSVGQILATVHTPLDSQQLNTLGDDLSTAIDPTGLGYFLGNFTQNYHLAQFGGLINQLLRTINFTQIGVLIESLPNFVTNLPATATALGATIEGANFTEVGSAANGYIATLGTLVAGCGAAVNDSSTYDLPASNSSPIPGGF